MRKILVAKAAVVLLATLYLSSMMARAEPSAAVRALIVIGGPTVAAAGL